MNRNREGKTPFNTVEIPHPGAANTHWFRRNIIFDQPKMTIYIQVMWDGTGTYLHKGEYERIKAGLWAEYVPSDYGPVIGAAVANGFTIQPVAVVGGTNGEMFNIMQIINLEDGRTTMKDANMSPISDNNISAIS